MSEAPIRVAVVGYGLGGSVFHAPLISTTPRLSLAAIVTSRPDRQAAAHRRYPDATIVPAVDDLLRDSDHLDLAVVTVPNAAHVGVAEALVQAGLSVVVDKPVAPTAEEVERLGHLAADRGVRVVPYHNRRWDGDFRTVAALIGSGRLGQLWRVESRFERWRPAAARPPSWKEDPGQPGGGILYDLGSHLIDQVLVLFGTPGSVYAELTHRDGPLDDDVFVALTYPEGPVVHLWASTKAAVLAPRFRLLGSSCGYVKYGLDVQEEALRAGRLPTEPGWGEEPPDAWGKLGTVDGVEAVPTLPGCYQQFYREMAACLLDGTAQPVLLEDAATGLRLIAAARASATSGRIVRLDDPT